jgi:type VI secretion system secreted protein Hcp
MRRISILVAAFALAALPLSASAGHKFTVQIEGTKQGKFKGECADTAMKDLLCGIDFDYEVTSPVDPSTGQASGRRQHKPVTIVKEVGTASPMIFQALVTSEVLKSVLITFYDTNAQGEEVVVYTIKLANARVADLRTYIRTSEDGRTTQLLESFSLTFQRIELESKTGKTMAMDDATK